MASMTFSGLTYSNGNCPVSLLVQLTPYGGHGVDGNDNAFLREDAARSWNRVRAQVLIETGIDLRVRGWNRSLEEQERFFFERYDPYPYPTQGPYGDVRWYKGVRYVRMRGASAAIPGNSNHGWGLAIDVIDFGGVGEWDNWRRVKTIDVFYEHGWTDTEGRQSHVNEPWHLVYDPSRDEHKGEKPMTETPNEEDEMNLSDKFALSASAAAIRNQEEVSVAGALSDASVARILLERVLNRLDAIEAKLNG